MNWVIVWIFGKNFVSDWPVGIVVAVENDLFLASVLKLTGFMRRGIEIDWMLEWRSQLASFQWQGRNALGFHLRDRNRFGFRAGIDLDMVVMRGSKPTSVVSGPKIINLVFGVGIEIDFGFVCGPKNTWFNLLFEMNLVMERGSWGAWFLCAGWNDFFLVWASADIFFVWVVEICFFFFCRLNIARFQCEHRT